MKNNKLTVTIGIPAFNEEKNIGGLVQRILEQKTNNFVLQKIIIVSDAGTDNTESVIKSLNCPKLLFIKNKKRLGQSIAQNQIIKQTHSDILVLLEADTLPANTSYIDNLLKPIIANKNVVLVQGNEQPHVAKSFIGKVISLQFTIYHEEMIKQFQTWFASGRGGRALKKNLYKEFHWPQDIPEDVYLHLFCKEKGYVTEFSTAAVCRYKLPETFHDIRMEAKKVKAGSHTIFEHFPKTLAEQIYKRSFLFRATCALRFLQTSPLYFLTYFLISLLMINDKTTFTDLLPVTQTTK